jgi:hypothetical protein
MPAFRQRGDHGFRFANRPGVTGCVGKADDAVGIGHVDPFGIIPGGEERNAKGLVEFGGEDLAAGRLRTVLGRTQGVDSPGASFCHEDIAIRRHPHLAWSAQSLGQQLDLESGGNLQHGRRRSRHDARTVRGRGGRARLRHIGGTDQPDDAGSVRAPFAERGVIGQWSVLRGGVARNEEDCRCANPPMHRLHDPSSVAVFGEDSLTGKSIRCRIRPDMKARSDAIVIVVQPALWWLGQPPLGPLQGCRRQLSEGNAIVAREVAGILETAFQCYLDHRAL